MTRHVFQKGGVSVLVLHISSIICISFGLWFNSSVLVYTGIAISTLSMSVFVYIRVRESKKEKQLQRQLARDALEYAKLEKRGYHIPRARTKEMQ